MTAFLAADTLRTAAVIALHSSTDCGFGGLYLVAQLSQLNQDFHDFAEKYY